MVNFFFSYSKCLPNFQQSFPDICWYINYRFSFFYFSYNLLTFGNFFNLGFTLGTFFTLGQPV